MNNKDVIEVAWAQFYKASHDCAKSTAGNKLHEQLYAKTYQRLVRLKQVPQLRKRFRM